MKITRMREPGGRPAGAGSLRECDEAGACWEKNAELKPDAATEIKCQGQSKE